MSKSSIIAVSVLALSFSVVFAQERASKQKAKEFSEVAEEVSRNWNAARYGHCLEGLRELTAMASAKRSEVLRAAFPQPAGWTIQVEKKKQTVNNPMLASMAASVGTMVEQRYDNDLEQARMTIKATIDSPLVSMMGMMFTNPALMEGELVKYGDHKAILKESGRNLELQIMIGDKHVVEVKASGIDADALFAIFDQAAIDKIATALSE